MPRVEGGREGTPCTAVFTDTEDSVKEAAVIDFYISPLYREEPDNFFLLFPGWFYAAGISYFLA
jgi:hypothetical protein